MKVFLPRDFTSYNAFKRLAIVMGQVNAVYVFTMLWVELGYEAEDSGTVGLLRKHSAWAFQESLTCYTDGQKREVLAFLCETEILVPRGEDYTCTWFWRANASLSFKPVAPANASEKMKLNHLTRRLDKSNQSSVDELKDPSFWKKADGTPIAPEEMKRAVLFIRTIDAILGKQRGPSQMSPGTVHEAIQVCAEFDDESRKLFLQNLISNQASPDMPDGTDQIIRRFKECYSMIVSEKGAPNGQTKEP